MKQIKLDFCSQLLSDEMITNLKKILYFFMYFVIGLHLEL